MRLIQSGEKEHADLSGCSGHGHLFLVCTERRRPRPLLPVNRLCRRQAVQMGVAKSDFSQMCRSRSDLIENVERFTRIDLDLSYFEKECNQSLCISAYLYVSVSHLSLSLSHPLPSDRHHLSCDDCLEDKSEDYQNCSVLYCVPQLYTVISTHTYEQFLQVY